MLDVPLIIKRAVDKCGFNRSSWAEKDIPNSLSNITVLVFFGDIRTSYILSSMLLKRYREQSKGSRYFILCTWPGFEKLFPYVNEVWTIKDEGILRKFFACAKGFDNTSELMVQYRRELNYWFEDVVGAETFNSLYEDGIKQEFWDRFKQCSAYMVSVPSSNILGDKINTDLNRPGPKVVICPVDQVRQWQRGKLEYIKTPKDFWVKLAQCLLDAHLTPVVYQSFFTHDISTELTDKCIYVTEKDIVKIFGMMRSVGCVLDVFSGISRWAIGARTPFLAIDERGRYNNQKEYEIDDLLCERGLPRRYIFLSPTILEGGNDSIWRDNFYEIMLSTLLPFMTKLNRDSWPSPLEQEMVVPYENVRRRRLKKMGTKFFVPNKDLRNGKL
jgi:hypothetical protein